MNHLDAFPKLGLASLTFGAAFLLVQIKCYAFPGQPQEAQQLQAQQPPTLPSAASQNSQPASQQTSPPDQQPAKKHKVWTNDDVVSLRTPADVYLAVKEAREAAAAESAAKVAAKAKLVDGAGPTERLPATVEETRKLIAAKESQIADNQQALDRYSAELPNEPAERKDRMQEEIDRITAGLPKERSELKVLQDHLEKLTKTQLNEATAPPPVPPSQ